MYYNKRVPTTRRRAMKMSLVRYTNKKTGVVSVYESTSHYDPVTKQSRPIRKYLGVEDPKTGEIIPSSGKPGRKKASDPTSRPAVPKKDSTDYKLLYEVQKKENAEKDTRIKELERQNKLLVANLEHLKDTITKALSATGSNSKG
jgi:hypothetical protein